MPTKGTYRDMVFEIVRRIPAGKVTSYGQIARMIPHCTARMVGYALASLPEENDVPWQRVINAKGRISPHGFGYGSAMQRLLLEEEGVQFNIENEISFEDYGWTPR